MPNVSASAEINAPPAKVWELMSDPNRYPELVEATDRMVLIPDEPLGVGSIYKEYGGIPPFKAESEWHVTVFEPMTHQVHLGDDGSMGFFLDIRVAPTAAGCRLTLSLDLKPHLFLILPSLALWPLLMRKRAQAVMDITVANTKRVAEAEASAGA